MAKKCESRKKNGERCGADAQTANGLCVFHDPAIVSEGRRARRAGGITQRRPRRYRPTHRIILSVTQPRSRFCWRAPSISFAEGNSIRA